MEKRLKKDKYKEREEQKYENPIPSREFILEHLAERGKPANYKQLVTELDLHGGDEKEALRRRLLAMVRDGQLLQNRRGAFGLIDKMELITGRIIGHKDGYGFLVPETGGDDIFIGPKQMRRVFHDDKVLARVIGEDYRGRAEAVIVEVLEHNTKQLVGRLLAESGVFQVQPSNQRIAQEIVIPPDATLHATNGQMVVVEITEQPTLHMRAIGKVVEILGDHMAPGMEVAVAIRNHDLPYEWPETVIHEAEKFSPHVLDDAVQNRLDLRALPFVTIDGEDAKDFDDAVYCEPQKNGGWILYVAIADVSHYVKPGSGLDEEAFKRGNSVYFPGRVIPMLPEQLSNELCSLKPFVNRLTMVAKMTIDKAGKITDYEFHEAVIRSHARLTYNKVFAMVVTGDKQLADQNKELMPHLQELFSLYKILLVAREQRGTIDFNLPETKIIYGKGRKIEKIVPAERNDAHKLIEECMLCANICAAHYLLKNECPALYRVHEGPSAEKLLDLRKFLAELGLNMPGRDIPTPSDYSALLKTIANRPDFHVIQTVLLRSLSQAIYSDKSRGHFGLAYDTYTHFTSPIRRYPDLLVHRGIRSILRQKIKPDDNGHLERIGEHCSMTERRADEATREAIDWLKCEFMMNKVGEEFPGVISGVTGFGFFVELTDIYVEGLVHISLLPNDYYQFDATRQALIGERSGRRFRLGDVVKVRVARVDLDERKIDFVLAEDEGEVKSKKPKKKSKRGF